MNDEREACIDARPGPSMRRKDDPDGIRLVLI
jgi:hypothetical protein